MEQATNFPIENQRNKRKCTDVASLCLAIGLIIIMLFLIIQGLTSLNSQYYSRRCNESFTSDSDLSKTHNQIELVCLYAILMSFLLLLLSRHFIKQIIWGTCIGSMFIISVFTIVVWKEPELLILDEWGLSAVEVFVIKIILTMILTIGAVLMVLYRREIRLVGYLYEEVSKEMIRNRSVILQPILTCLVAVLAAFFFKNLLGTLENDRFTYPQALSMILYFWFNVFIYGCQNFMIAGTVSKHYQKQDETNSRCKFLTIFAHLIHFHLGSVCYGRFITILKPVAKIILKFYGSHKQEFDHLFVSDTIAHIITIQDASKYSKSTKRAFNVVKKFRKIFQLSNFGAHALLLVQVFVVGGSIGISQVFVDEDKLDVQFYVWTSLVISLATSYCFISAYIATIQATIFCFCMNLEASRPCLMSKTLTNILCDLIKYYGIQYDNDAHPNVQDDFVNNNYIILPFPSDYDLTGHIATGTYCPYYIPPPMLLSVSVHSDDSGTST